jgi:N-acetylmuramic acid 6-phosphate etherase
MLADLPTEGRLPEAADLDLLATGELVRRLVEAEHATLRAVSHAAPAIAQAVEAIWPRLERGGRLFYCGAGTSGRLGALDAAECPPTFGTPPERVQALLAGGPAALTRAVEGAEDDTAAGALAIGQARLAADDVLVAIAASGRTPFCLGAVEAARAAGAMTIALVCVAASPLAERCALAIEVPVGPEVLSGSTRLKAGTATKLVLNALSTASMVRLGKTYGDLMVDVQASNQKLRARAQRLLQILTGCTPEEAEQRLQAAGGELKTAVVAARRGLSIGAARRLLDAHGGRLRRALEAPALNAGGEDVAAGL